MSVCVCIPTASLVRRNVYSSDSIVIIVAMIMMIIVIIIIIEIRIILIVVIIAVNRSGIDSRGIPRTNSENRSSSRCTRRRCRKVRKRRRCSTAPRLVGGR